MFGQENNQEKIVAPKDFFLSVASMILLYVSAISLIGLLFQYINVLFPDPLQTWTDPYNGAVRGFMASLIVTFPLYLWFTRMINQDTRKNPEKKESFIRRWLTYLTLFVAGGTIAIDLVVLINTFLGGELTTRFLLKVLVVLVVIGAGLFYYVFDLQGKWQTHKKNSVLFGGIISAFIIITIVGGFFIIGSPRDARLTRFDVQKVSDLQTIQWNVTDYFQRTRSLPENLDLL